MPIPCCLSVRSGKWKLKILSDTRKGTSSGTPPTVHLPGAVPSAVQNGNAGRSPPLPRVRWTDQLQSPPPQTDSGDYHTKKLPRKKRPPSEPFRRHHHHPGEKRRCAKILNFDTPPKYDLTVYPATDRTTDNLLTYPVRGQREDPSHHRDWSESRPFLRGPASPQLRKSLLS